MITLDWNIKPRAAACGKCQTLFADRQVTVSRLTEQPEGLARLDCCESCWSEADRIPGTVSVWRGVYEPPPPPPPEPLKKETAESLLQALLRKNDPADAPVVFVLAVMLERRRLLVERDVAPQPDGTRRRVYEHRKTGETFLVIDPQLPLDRVADVQALVMERLAAPAAADPAAAEPAADAGPQEPHA